MKNINIDNIRHSLAHILAESVLLLYPDSTIAIGPTIENGFYYDIDFKDKTINDDDLLKIEKKMKSIIDEKRKFVKK